MLRIIQMAKAFNFPQNFGKRLSPIAPTFTPKISSLFSPFAKSFVPDSKSSIGHSKLSEVARSYKVFVPSAPGVPEVSLIRPATERREADVTVY